MSFTEVSFINIMYHVGNDKILSLLCHKAVMPVLSLSVTQDRIAMLYTSVE